MIVLAALAAAAASPPSRVVPLDHRTWLVRGTFEQGRQPDGNSVIFAGPGGIVVFDTGRHLSHSRWIERVIRGQRKHLLAIVNSHWHLDHVSGNLRLQAAHPRLKVYASDAIDGALNGFLKDSAAQSRKALADGAIKGAQAEDVRGDLATIARGKQLRPDITISKPVTQLSIGGRSLALHLERKAATAGDIWAYDGAAKRVASGDLVTLPVPFLDTACPDGWKSALAAIAQSSFTSLVPGHGPVLNRAQFNRYRSAFDAFVDCAKGQPEERCASGWLRDAGPLVPASEQKRARAMARYYAGRIRSGALEKYCA